MSRIRICFTRSGPGLLFILTKILKKLTTVELIVDWKEKGPYFYAKRIQLKDIYLNFQIEQYSFVHSLTTIIGQRT